MKMQAAKSAEFSLPVLIFRNMKNMIRCDLPILIDFLSDLTGKPYHGLLHKTSWFAYFS